MLYIDIQHLIAQVDNLNDEDELSLISDMWQFNIRRKMRQESLIFTGKQR